MEWKKSVIEEYSLVEETSGRTCRQANIIIRDGKFEICKYDGLGVTYNLEDWSFLGKVAVKISELVKLFSKEKKCKN